MANYKSADDILQERLGKKKDEEKRQTTKSAAKTNASDKSVYKSADDILLERLGKTKADEAKDSVVKTAKKLASTSPVGKKKQSTDSNYTSFRMQTKYMLKSMLMGKLKKYTLKKNQK